MTNNPGGETLEVDFAISYAGEDLEPARAVTQRLRELGFTVFLADEQRRSLVGMDGEAFFERLFTEAKQVVAFISASYRAKDWPRFEWDVIRKRDRLNRYIPVRLDDSPILGLPSNVIHVTWTGDNLSDVVDSCVERLLMFEREAGITRPSQFDRVLTEIKDGSRGSLAKAYQLVVDKRARSLLDDASMPTGGWAPRYAIVEWKWANYSRVKRRLLKVVLPDDLKGEELVFNLKHCCITDFNDTKADAVSVCAYSRGADLSGSADVAVIEFAPFGDWGRAEEGVAYNLPTSEFDFRLQRISRF